MRTRVEVVGGCGVQMRYKFGASGLELYKPAKYTACTQQLATGSWVLPAADSEEWLCARPVDV